jgi:hypothetical protein
MIHEQTYKGLGIAAVIHRRRLDRIFRVFNSLEINDNGQLGDFGCSNGFIIALLQEGIFKGKGWKFHGFDHAEHLLSLAKARNLRDAEFHFSDFNVVRDQWDRAFNIVLCFETLEHTGNYRNAVLNLYNSCQIGGKIIITIPNEKGLPGLLKYIGRKVLRKNAYGDFFKGKSELRYIWHLLSDQSIEVFRSPEEAGWGPHLGFDWKLFEKFLSQVLIEKGKCRLLSRDNTPISFNRFYILEKLQ